MKRNFAALAVLPSLLLLGACGNAASPPPADTVATVNGKAIDKSEFEMYLDNVQQQSKREVTAEEKSEILDQFIGMKLAAEAAEKSGIAKQPKVEDQLALARMNVIVDAGL